MRVLGVLTREPTRARSGMRARLKQRPSHNLRYPRAAMPPPQLHLPPGACDCHMHVYEDRYPLVPQATFKPPHAPLADYLQVQRALGLSRAVVVQPNGYGFDNRCTLEALSALGGAARGVATVPVEVADDELE